MGFDPISLAVEAASAISSAAPAWGTVATAASIGSAGLGALGAIQSSQAEKASAKYNAAVAGENAQIATQNSQFAGAEGEQNIATAQAKTRAEIGATLANQGASGVDINSGSSVDVRESEAKLGMLNALNVRSQATRQAYGFQTSAASDLGQQSLDKQQAKYAGESGYINAGANVLGGVSNTYLKYLNGGSVGGLTNTGYGDPSGYPE